MKNRTSKFVSELLYYIDHTKERSVALIQNKVLYFHAEKFKNEFKKCDFSLLRDKLRKSGFVQYDARIRRKEEYYYFHPFFFKGSENLHLVNAKIKTLIPVWKDYIAPNSPPPPVPPSPPQLVLPQPEGIINLEDSWASLNEDDPLRLITFDYDDLISPVVGFEHHNQNFSQDRPLMVEDYELDSAQDPIFGPSSSAMEIGFIGLGSMGKPMAFNLLLNGFKLTVWNSNQSKCEELVDFGASIGETPAAVVKKCKYTIAMLSDPSDALSVVFGTDGVLEQICEGKGYVDMSTVDADTSLKIHEGIAIKGGSFLEAPVSGSTKLAEDGQLVILAAGDKALYEEALPAFDVMGKKSFFLGRVGDGAKMKLVVNMITGSMMNAFSEGLVLANESGLSQQTLLDVLELGGIAFPAAAANEV